MLAAGAALVAVASAPANARTAPPPTLTPSTGPVTGGTLVRIAGESLLLCTLVTFGGATATIVDRAPDNAWIEVLTPAGTPGSVTVTMGALARATMTRAAGCNWDLPNAFTYEAVPVDDGPAPWLQQIGRTGASSACLPGWNPSWAEWPNGGAGGFVCTREQYWAGSDWAFRKAITAS